MVSRSNILFLLIGIGAGVILTHVFEKRTITHDAPQVASENTLQNVAVENSSGEGKLPIHPLQAETARHGKKVPETGSVETGENSVPATSNSDRDARSNPKPIVKKSRLESLDDASEIDRFVDDARVGNLFDELRKANSFNKMEDGLNQLNGRFSGTVQFSDDPRKTWDVQLEAALRIESGTLKGDTKILLSENGRVFSNLSGDGNQGEHYRSISDGIGIVVKASPDAYFQLYYLPRVDAFVGNYYKQVSPDQVLPKGTIRLNRG